MMLCWLLIVLFIAVILWSSQEHMTNKDLIDTLKTFGVDNSGQIKPQAPAAKQEIFGPALKESEKPPPRPLSDEDEAKKRAMRNLYPRVYGPDYHGAPGQKFEPPSLETSEKPYTDYHCAQGQEFEPSSLETSQKPYTDPGVSKKYQSESEPYYFNPDLQTSFRVDGPPQPFLTDFSKFQK